MMFAAVLATAGAARSPYRAEADSFLTTIAPGWQHSQAMAIRRAINGNTSQLDSIRAARGAVPPAVPPEVTTTDGPGWRLYRSPRHDNAGVGGLPLLVYLHGGGWTIGSIGSCAGFCCDLAATGDVAVLAVDYRLAPENPYPAALNDCCAAFAMAVSRAREWGCDSSKVAIGGDSSGGNLAIATALSLAAGGSANAPAAIVAFYPVVKAMSDDTPSWRDYGRGYGLDSEWMEAFNAAYIAGMPPEACHDPFVSPAEAPDSLLATLPPTLIVAAGRDILADSGRAFARRLAQLGVDVEHETIDEAVHLFITVGGQPSARRRGVELAASMLRRL